MNAAMMPAASIFGLQQPEQQEPFMWGEGGQRMTPQEVAMRRAEAARMMETGMDFSPVGHWTQGLSRALQGGIGGYMDSNAREAQSENEAVDAEIRAALMAGDVGDDALAAALLDPAASDNTRRFAEAEYQRRQPSAQDYNAFEKMLLGAGMQPGTPEWAEANEAAIAARVDPFTTATLPGNRFYSGPASGLATVMGGGGQVSGAGQTTQPPAEAIEALRRGEGTPEQFDEQFGPGAAAQVMGGTASNGGGGFR